MNRLYVCIQPRHGQKYAHSCNAGKHLYRIYIYFTFWDRQARSNSGDPDQTLQNMESDQRFYNVWYSCTIKQTVQLVKK